MGTGHARLCSDEYPLAIHRELVPRHGIAEGMIYLQITSDNPGDTVDLIHLRRWPKFPEVIELLEFHYPFGKGPQTDLPASSGLHRHYFDPSFALPFVNMA